MDPTVGPGPLWGTRSLGWEALLVVAVAAGRAEVVETLSEMLRGQGIDEGVEAGIGIRKAMGCQAAGVGGPVEGEVTKPEIQDDHMVGQPAKAKEGSHRQHGAAGPSFGLAACLQGWAPGVHRYPEEAKGAGIGQAYHSHRQKVSHSKGHQVQGLTMLVLPTWHTQHQLPVLYCPVVTEVRSRKEQGQEPN